MSRQHTLHPPWYRRWAVQFAAVAVAAGLLGAGVEHYYIHDDTGHEQVAEVRTETVTRVPDGCLAALDGVDRALERAIMFGQGMVDMSKSDGGMHSFEKEGSHHQDSLRFTEHMTGVTEQFRADKTACRG